MTRRLARLAGLAVAVILAAGGLAGCESPGPRITSMAFGSDGGSTLRTACNPTAGPPAVAYVRVRSANRSTFKVKVEVLGAGGFARVGTLTAVGGQVVLGNVTAGTCLSARYSTGRAVTLELGIWPA